MSGWRNFRDEQWLRLSLRAGSESHAEVSAGRAHVLGAVLFAILTPLALSSASLLTEGVDSRPCTARAKSKEQQMNMKLMALASTVSLATGIASGDTTGTVTRYARFSAPSDTIRILGNTTFSGTDWTYEMRIRIHVGTPARSQIISEQRDSVEDKTVAIDEGSLIKATVRGGACGDIASHPADESVLGSWRHFAWVRSGSLLTFFIDGQPASTWPSVPECTADSPDSWMSIGMFRYGAGYSPTGPIPSFLGDLDWIRISDGARYSSSFVPPFECEVQPDATCELLLKFNEDPGTAVLVDESPNAFTCELGVPVSPGVDATSPTLGNSDESWPSCPQPCGGDLDNSETVNGVDLAIILQNWGSPSPKYPQADITGDGVVNGADLAIVLSNWGDCL
jgi:hypothetical protein